MKEFLKKYKQSIFRVGMLLLVMLGISALTLGVLALCNIITFKGGIAFNLELFASFKNSFGGAVLFFVLQTVLCMLLSFIPGVSMAFILLSVFLFDNIWTAFFVSFASVMFSSAVMFILGRFGGYKLCVKLLGEDDCNHALDLLRNKGTVYFPLMMMFPAFPDDALVMMAGVIKMKLAWFIPSIILCRGIGIATTVFLTDIIPFDTFNGIYDWGVFISACAFWVCAAFWVAGKLNQFMEKRRKKAETKEQ